MRWRLRRLGGQGKKRKPTGLASSWFSFALPADSVSSFLNFFLRFPPFCCSLRPFPLYFCDVQTRGGANATKDKPLLVVKYADGR
jgi:hypothetical protein